MSQRRTNPRPGAARSPGAGRNSDVPMCSRCLVEMQPVYADPHGVMYRCPGCPKVTTRCR